MREIKFRAWDKVNKIMHEDAFDAVRSFTSMMYRPERFALMQFTGLKDKNGKEIYEGDVVAFNKQRGVVAGVVAIDEDWLEVSIIDIDNIEPIYEDYKSRMEKWYILKVIGNIYDNPELIK